MNPRKNAKRWFLESAGACHAHRSKRKRIIDPEKTLSSIGAGDDSLWLSKACIGCADGVGEFGEGSAWWSRTLTHYMKLQCDEIEENNEDRVAPMRMFERAFKKMSR